MPGPELHGMEVELDVPIRMSDGVVLRASIAHPTDLATGTRAAGLFPVLLEQSPYHQQPAQDGAAASSFTLLSRYFVARGYIYVSAQVRGTHHSGGDFGLMSEREKQDGRELVDWVAHRLEGSDGRVGLTGCSYTGLNQYFTAALVGRNSPVKAIAPTGVGIDWYREPGFMGGVPTVTLEKSFFEVWANGGTESAARFTLGVLADFKAGGDIAYDRDFWQARSAANVIRQIVENGIPALIFAGWRDYPSSPSEAYAMFQNAFAGRDPWVPMAPGESVTTRYQLIIGSDPHCCGREAGAMAEATLRWFDTWVKGLDTGLGAGRATAHLKDVDTGRWVSGTAYPPVERYQTYFLHPDGALSTAVPDEADASDRLCYAAPAYPGASLTYTTAPFAKGAIVAGPIAATLYAKSTTPDLIVIADLFDIAPDGKARQLATGALIGSHRRMDDRKTWRDKEGRVIRPYHVSTGDEPIGIGEVVRLDVQIQPRVATVAAGHSLRLLLKTQSDPALSTMLFPGGGAFWCLNPTVPQRRNLQGGVFDIQRNRAWASLINVPLMFD